MPVIVRKYTETDIPSLVKIWNEVVEDGIAYPQTDTLTARTARKFFAEQTWCAVAEDTDNGKVLGLYILHPNNIGRCGHLANASFAVASSSRGMKVGEALVGDCLETARKTGFRILQFNAVVRTNVYARRLYEKMGFVMVGEIPGGFLMKDGHYEDICLYYKTL